jgi:hypothetical protein
MNLEIMKGKVDINFEDDVEVA